jgi:hypothetical protein
VALGWVPVRVRVGVSHEHIRILLKRKNDRPEERHKDGHHDEERKKKKANSQKTKQAVRTAHAIMCVVFVCVSCFVPARYGSWENIFLMREIIVDLGLKSIYAA